LDKSSRSKRSSEGRILQWKLSKCVMHEIFKNSTPVSIHEFIAKHIFQKLAHDS
jgi:hypothetical protein